MEQRISLLTLGVSDLQRARRFYEGLGWHTNARPEDDVVFFQAGGMILALWGRQQLAAELPRGESETLTIARSVVQKVRETLSRRPAPVPRTQLQASA